MCGGWPVDRCPGAAVLTRYQHHHAADVQFPDRLPELADRVLGGALGDDDGRLVTDCSDETGVDVGTIRESTARQSHAVLVVRYHVLHAHSIRTLHVHAFIDFAAKVVG